MQALMKTAPGPGNIEVREAAKPSAKAGEVVIRVSSCGICGSDLTVYRTDDFARIYPASLPRIMGHEFAGEVVEVGQGVESALIGQWATVNPHVFDGTCEACLRGQEELCENRPLYGVDQPGAMAELIAVRSSNLHVLPEDVARAVGAMGEPLAVGVHAVERLQVKPNETVAVIGAGPIGLLILVALQEAGVERIVISGLDADRDRLKLAEAFGVDVVVEGEDTLTTRGKELTGGRGFDVIFEAAGVPSAIESALNSVRQGGRVGVLGLPHEPIAVSDPFDFVLSEKSLIGTRAYTPRSWDTTVEILRSRRDDLEKLVTRRMPLTEWHEAFELLNARAAMKIFLEP